MRTLYFIGCVLLTTCGHTIHAQTISDREKDLILPLIDSVDKYELTEPQRSIQFINEVLSRVPEYGNEEIHVKMLITAANCLKILSQKDEALASSSKAIRIAERVNDLNFMIRSYYMKASIFSSYGYQDSSLIYYHKVIDLHHPGIDPYFVSGAFSGIGDIYREIGNLDKAEEYLLKGYESATSDEYAKIFALSTLINFYASHDNPKYLPYLDTLANSNFYKNASEESFMAHFDSFLRLDKASDAQKLKRLREVYEYGKANSPLVSQVGYGLKLYQQLDKMHKYEEAHVLLKELHEKSKETKNDFRIHKVTEALFENSKRRGNARDALYYLELHTDVKDSLLSIENRKLISELNIKFETAQKDFEISQQKAKIERQQRDRNFFFLLASLVATLAVFVFIYFRNRARTMRAMVAKENVIHRQETERLQREKELAELTATLDTQEKERNRIARDLHDGIGSMMSGISSQIEYLRSQPGLFRNSESNLIQLRELIKDAISELRRTSYELMPDKLLRQGLEPAIRDLCINLLVKNGVEPSLEINTDLETLNNEQQLTLYRIIQELLNNIVKHAEAKIVLIQFNRIENQISLVVEDDGKGFDTDDKKKNGGLGLGSLQSRVNLLNGFLDIASTPGQGTTVTINFKAKTEAEAKAEG